MKKETKKINTQVEDGKKRYRELKGLVMSDKMDKTIVVKVDVRKSHSIYKKRYTVSKRYKAHDELNQYKAGDFVLIRQSRPLSKGKKWKVIKKIKPNT